MHLKQNLVTTETNLSFDELNRVICLKIEEILRYFNVKYYKTSNCISMKCPIHESSKDSMNIFLTGEKKRGNFVCWTKHCEQTCGDSSVFVIKALLEKQLQKKLTVSDVADFLSYELDVKFESVEKDIEAENFIHLASKRTTNSYANSISKEIVRSNLQIPARYYINRGFSKRTLDKFDVGTCYEKGFQMYSRVVVPVYDITGTKFVGCVGRSQNQECSICGMYHSSKKTCPTDNVRHLYGKWMNSKGFRSGDYIYGIWNALEAIQERSSIILVEGQGDVWKAVESGKENVGGLFGDSIKKEQIRILNTLGIMNVYLALDNDSAGQIATTKITKQLENYFNVYTVKYSAKDVGEADKSELKRVFQGI